MLILASNKRATFDYHILETFEGGLVLTGGEVKSIKAGQAQLKGSFVFIRGKTAVLKGAYIAPYKPVGNQDDYDAYRDRKILLHAREIQKLLAKQQTERLTIVPICVYVKRNLVKIEIGLARGKRQYEKRETIKKRDVERHLRERMRE